METEMITDITSCDTICASCGTVNNRDTQLTPDFNTEETQSMDYDRFQDCKKEITYLIKKFKMSVSVERVLPLVLEYFSFSKEAHTIRFLTCAMFLKVSSEQKKIYLTNHVVYTWAKKMKIAFTELKPFISRHCDLGFYSSKPSTSKHMVSMKDDRQEDKENTTNEENTAKASSASLKQHAQNNMTECEWIANLQKVAKALFLKCCFTYKRQMFVQIDNECDKLVTRKSTSIFHSLEDISGVVLNKLFGDQDDEFKAMLFRFVDRTKVLKIQRLVYD
jgi:hypothetical protein